jgi:hypothetical protein
MEIPTRHQEFIKKIVELAKEHGISEFHGEIKPFTIGPCGSGNFDSWQEPISFHWTQGRHGAGASCRIESTARISILI